jgi:hypothetical protein
MNGAVKFKTCTAVYAGFASRALLSTLFTAGSEDKNA